MKATPEIREEILKEISSTVLKILECNDPNDHRMALATGYIGGILKGLEIMGTVDIKDAQCLEKDILLFKKFFPSGSNTPSREEIQAILEKHLKEAEDSET